MTQEQKELISKWLTTARELPTKGGPTQWVFENWEMLKLLEIIEGSGGMRDAQKLIFLAIIGAISAVLGFLHQWPLIVYSWRYWTE